MGLSEETKRKISLSLTGRKVSEETKKKISEANKGRVWSEEHRINYQLAITDEWKRKISTALKGRPTSDEHRKNLSIALKGNKNCLGREISEEHKAKINQTGRKRTLETKEKMRMTKLGKPGPWMGKARPEETRKKISENLYGRFRGEESPTWKGGCSPYGSDFNEVLREQIRDRDGRICQMCGIKENGKKLDVHHIDYDKTNNDPENMVALCHICHCRTTHKDRDGWIVFFKNRREPQ